MYKQIKELVNDIRNDVLYNTNMSNHMKLKLLEAINDSEIIDISDIPISNKKYIIRLSEIDKHTLLHELFHIVLSHNQINRNKIHNPCIIENLIYDYLVEENIKKYFQISTNKDIIYQKLLEYNIYNISLDSIILLSCSNCEYKNCYYKSNTANTSNVTIKTILEKLKSKLFEYLYDMTTKTIIPVRHRNYVKNQYYVISKYDKRKEINIVIDTSTSIDKEIIDLIINTCKDFENKLTNINIYGFSDIVYKLNKDNIRYIDKTNFYDVYRTFQFSDNVILISDLAFTRNELDLLESTKFKVINICSLS